MDKAWRVTGQHYQGRGRKEKLTKAQQKQLINLIKAGPESNDFIVEYGTVP